MFNQQERVALLFLSAALLVGSVAAMVDYRDPSRLEEFAVVRGAVAVAEPARVNGVPEDAPPSPAGEKSIALVNVNSAAVAELRQLPSVGPKTAERIVKYREEHGPFASVEALEQVAGIGPRTLERLRPFVVLR